MDSEHVENLTAEVKQLRKQLAEELGNVATELHHQGTMLRQDLEQIGRGLAAATDHRARRRQEWAGRIYATLVLGAMQELLAGTLGAEAELDTSSLGRLTWELVAALEAAEPAAVRPDVEGDDQADVVPPPPAAPTSAWSENGGAP